MAKRENRLVVGSWQWAQDIPEWLLQKVREERIIHGLMSIMDPDIEKVGDAEMLVYLFPATMTAPMRAIHNNIYLYLVTTVIEKCKGKIVPDDIKKTELSEAEQRELKNLKAMIYRSRGGDIQHPVLEVLRQLKKTISKESISKERTLFDI